MPETKNTINRHFFTNENVGNGGVVNVSGSYGVLQDNMQIDQISDTINEHGQDLNKIASSMPSPVARLFLFSAALKELNRRESANPGTAFECSSDDDGNLIKSPYHELVAQMLDMFEFIYKYGDFDDFHVYVWNKKTECKKLINTGRPEFKNLAKALDSAFSFGALNNTSEIYLFKWKDKVIGGSSPVSLVYTSVNMPQCALDGKFTGNAGNVLFKDNDVPCPLHLRDEGFRTYMYCLYHSIVATTNNHLKSLQDYIQYTGVNYDVNLYNRVRQNPGNRIGLKPMTSQGSQISISGIKMYVTSNEVVVNSSTTDYIMQPSLNRTAYIVNAKSDHVPLVLTSKGVDGYKYVSRTWNCETDSLVNPNSDVQKRYLPGFGNVVYPFIKVDDFLEEKVILLSYGINNNRFYTGSEDSMPILLPIKKEFFKYFSVNDLINNDMLFMKYDEERNKVIVDLRIPLVNKKQISLHRVYEGENIIDCYDASNSFDFAVFPFYRLESDLTKNVYNVMFGSSIDNIGITFYESSDTKCKDLNDAKEIQDELRVAKNKDNSINSRHIRVNGAFNIMEISIPVNGVNYNAIVVPKFDVIDNAAIATKYFKYSIDFGTTNTHVAYVSVQHPGDAYSINNINPFEYDEISDPQMVLFNDPYEGAGEFIYFKTAVNRELVPSSLGDTIKYPMRTCTYQIGQPDVLKTFANTNIGYNYGQDISRSDNYRTNIKWDRFNNNAQSSMASYFEQILWMMKNKSISNNGTDHFDLVVTYPISMRTCDLSQFKAAWADAKRALHCGVDIKYRTESVAPYYSALAHLKYGEPYANMDIGGGTTDMLCIDPISGEGNVFSAFFAADDLWNDGLMREVQTDKANGFLTYYKRKRLETMSDQNTCTEINSVIDHSKSSADIINYLFANDERTLFSQTISSSREMMQLPIIHFSALTFYMAYCMHMSEIDIPTKMSFTGMGSKYIRLISNDEDIISQLMNKIFDYVGRVLDNDSLRESRLNLMFPDKAKEITANGSLMSIVSPDPIFPSEDIYMGYPEENPENSLRYNQLSNDIEDHVMDFYSKFVDMFKDDSVFDVLLDMGFEITDEVISDLKKNGRSSFNLMKKRATKGVSDKEKIREPLFFWPLKNTLYTVGQNIANKAD